MVLDVSMDPGCREAEDGLVASLGCRVAGLGGAQVDLVLDQRCSWKTLIRQAPRFATRPCEPARA